MRRIAIIGFGFSGSIAAANLVRDAVSPLTLYIVDETADARGVAYATTNPEHLLNVRAAGMSAWADAPEHFVAWLATDAAKQAQARMGISGNFSGDDFVPRMLYGAYLQSIWRETQDIAAQKNCSIKLVPSRAVAIRQGDSAAVLTARGDAIAVDTIILAVGHETKPILPNVVSPHIIQNPWAEQAFGGAANWPSPVMLVGTGLTAVDVMLSLRRAGYAGEIVAASFSGCLPQPHATPTAVFAFGAQEIAALKTLTPMLHMLRTKIRELGDWRVAIDALRPHTQALWQRLTTRHQQHFLSRLNTRWITHRHRMAPEIAATIDAEIAAQKLRLMGCKTIEARQEEGQLAVTIIAHNAVEQLHPSRVMNCAGLELNLARSKNPLLRHLLADGCVEPHATGLGVAVDPHCRAWGNLHPYLYVIGSLMTGQLLESTAVPELRAQAASISQAIGI
jgi:uncharacterized NAD(P)/FAD-binding protein YdhS